MSKTTCLLDLEEYKYTLWIQEGPGLFSPEVYQTIEEVADRIQKGIKEPFVINRGMRFRIKEAQ